MKKRFVLLISIGAGALGLLGLLLGLYEGMYVLAGIAASIPCVYVMKNEVKLNHCVLIIIFIITPLVLLGVLIAALIKMEYGILFWLSIFGGEMILFVIPRTIEGVKAYNIIARKAQN